jgi:hypothetical protein
MSEAEDHADAAQRRAAEQSPQADEQASTPRPPSSGGFLGTLFGR